MTITYQVVITTQDSLKNINLLKWIIVVLTMSILPDYIQPMEKVSCTFENNIIYLISIVQQERFIGSILKQTKRFN